MIDAFILTHKFMCMKVRKNITLSEEADRFLREIARKMEKAQSEVVEELIMEKAKEIEKEKKLRAFRELIGRAKEISIPDDITVQKVKEEIGLEKLT